MGRKKKSEQRPKPRFKKFSPFQRIKGTEDILPQDQIYWDFVRETVFKTAKKFNYQWIETPILEETELFLRGTGLSSEVVTKQMYSFQTKGGEDVSLRPETTPGIVRAFIQNGLHTLPQPLKLFWFGPMFRYEQPQAGRKRQFYQFGFEIFSERESIADAQILQLSLFVCKKLNLNVSLQINSIGCLACRRNFSKILTNFYKSKIREICPDCQERLKLNPLRILDCKIERCQKIALSAPQTIEHLCPFCHEHFKKVLEYLDEIEIFYTLNPKLVRGFDYYTKTVFEIFSVPTGKSEEELTGQSSLAGGGRYDNLVEILGGRDTPAVGIGFGIERIISELKEKKPSALKNEERVDVFLIQLGEQARKRSLKLYGEFQNKKMNIREALSKTNIKTQLSLASEKKAKYVLIIGEKEVADNTVILRDMESGNQEIIPFEKSIEEIKNRIK